MQQIGQCPDGQAIHAIPLKTDALDVTIVTLGAGIRDVRLAGHDHNLTWRPDDVGDYFKSRLFHGLTVGPVANRIGGASATLEGEAHAFEANEHGRNTLHSGPSGVHLAIWTPSDHGESAVTLSLDLPHGRGGFPGERRVQIRYELTPPSTLRMEITAETDRPTWMNLANHAYWNLDGTPNWAGHALQISGDRIQEVDEDLIPSGRLLDVDGTDMDFRETRRPSPGNPALDNNFCTGDAQTELREVLTLTGSTGVGMRLATTEPGVQVFDGRPSYRALAIEAQGWPDAPNHPGFPPVRLDPGQTYRQVTEWRLSG